MKKAVPVTMLLIFLASISISIPARAQVRQFTLFLYAAKFVCGKSNERTVSPGQYFTAINVHNASPTTEVRYIKRFAIALPEERPGKLSEFVVGTIPADHAMGIDCDNIYKHTNTPPGQFLEGYALLYSLGELDVVSVHTAGHSEVETVDTERVPARRFSLGRSKEMSRLLSMQ